jgi:hypothetical protein
MSFSLIFSLTVDATLLNIRTCNSSGERINSHPQQRKDGCKKNRPHDNNGGCPVLATHQTFEERVEMDDHPEGKEKLAKEWTPRLVTTVDGMGYPGNNTYQVNDEESCWWDEQSCPFKHVQFSEITVLV